MGFLEKIKNIFRKSSIPVVAKKVKFGYKEKEVLKDISLTVKKGKIVSIIGKSGSGKTTFLKLLAGVQPKSHQGKIKILGNRPNFSKKDIGFVPQDIAVIPDMTVEENIKFFGGLNGLTEKESLDRGKKLVAMLNLQDSIRSLPDEMSGGERTRLNIIVSFLHDPSILILDEPFVGLDFENRRLLWHFFESLKKKKKSIIITTHLLTEAEKHTDRILILNRGKIQFYGNAENIKKKLKAIFIMEIHFQYLSKDSLKEIEMYCERRTIEILDQYKNYIMFSLEKKSQKEQLEVFFDKKDIVYKLLSFKTPTMDEAFLGAK